jgi:hypothetical protein
MNDHMRLFDGDEAIVDAILDSVTQIAINFNLTAEETVFLSNKIFTALMEIGRRKYNEAYNGRNDSIN